MATHACWPVANSTNALDFLLNCGPAPVSRTAASFVWVGEAYQDLHTYHVSKYLSTHFSHVVFRFFAVFSV